MQRINIERKKLANAIVFFIHSIKNLNKTLLMKLLYDFEFKHIAKKGKPVFGLKYCAWDWGPVPIDVFYEISDKQTLEGFESYFIVTKEKSFEDGDRYDEYNFKTRKTADLQYFTQSEIHLLEQVAYIYKNTTAKMASQIHHEKGKPWEMTVKKTGIGSEIDYNLAFEDRASDADDLKIAKERLSNWYLLEKNFPR